MNGNIFLRIFFRKIILTVFTTGFISSSFANDDTEIMNLRLEFYGIWCYYAEGAEMYYTISNDKLVAFDAQDSTGFVVKIDNWQFIDSNHKYDSEDYRPAGFAITGSIVEMTGNWWKKIGDSDTWIWYRSVLGLEDEDGDIWLRKQ